MTPLEQTARAALQSYDLHDARLKRLGGLTNVNFQVATTQSSYLLRLHTPKDDERAAITSELVWLEYLRAETPLPLQKPIRNARGEYLTELDDYQTFCTLLSWVEGRTIGDDEALTDSIATQAGTLMAQLHSNAIGFKLPLEFTRPSYEEAYFLRRCHTLLNAFEGDALDADDKAVLEEGVRSCTALWRRLPRTPEAFGLIHADFHSGNYLLNEDTLRIIDFGRCGFAFFAFDIALALMELEEPQRQAFLEGYSSLQALPPYFEEHKGVFLLLGYIDNFGFLAQRPEEQTFVKSVLPDLVNAFRRHTP